MNFTTRQEVALNNPCFYAQETGHPRFKRVIVLRGIPISVILTLNIGEE
jgi:hypothetical protein